MKPKPFSYACKKDYITAITRCHKKECVIWKSAKPLLCPSAQRSLVSAINFLSHENENENEQYAFIIQCKRKSKKKNAPTIWDAMSSFRITISTDRKWRCFFFISLFNFARAFSFLIRNCFHLSASVFAASFQFEVEFSLCLSRTNRKQTPEWEKKHV